jgi:hypothetical protein
MINIFNTYIDNNQGLCKFSKSFYFLRKCLLQQVSFRKWPKEKEGQTMKWPKEKEGQTMKWPKEKEQNDDANNDLQNITQKNKRSSNNKPGGGKRCLQISL